MENIDYSHCMEKQKKFQSTNQWRFIGMIHEPPPSSECTRWYLYMIYVFTVLKWNVTSVEPKNASYKHMLLSISCDEEVFIGSQWTHITPMKQTTLKSLLFHQHIEYPLSPSFELWIIAYWSMIHLFNIMFIIFIFIYTTREMNHDEPTSPSIERGSENPRDPWRKDGQAPHAWSPRTSTTAHAMRTLGW